jgi:hypothetical protein
MTSAPASKTAVTDAEARDRSLRPRFDSDDFFGAQPASTATLPDPAPLLENLTRCVIEVLAGARDLEQLARWVSDDVYRHLLKRKCNLGRCSTSPRKSRVDHSLGPPDLHRCRKPYRKVARVRRYRTRS